MRSSPLTRRLPAAALLAAVAAPALLAQTTVEDLVMYTIEDEDQKLHRFTFLANEFIEIGVVTDQFGGTVVDCEAMAYIPWGLSRGLYTSCNSTAPAYMKQKLIRIDPLTAKATIFPYPAGPSTHIGYIRGSAPFLDTTVSPNRWLIYGAQSKNSGTECRLVTIDPTNGLLLGTPLEVRDAADLTEWVVMEGLGINSDGAIFGVEHLSNGAAKRSQLWSITLDPGNGLALATAVGPRTAYRRVECLEFAIGDQLPSLISGLPSPASTWPQSLGVLLGYSDFDDAFLIMDSGTGAVQEFLTINGNPLKFKALDVECMIITTQLRDVFGDLVDGYD